MDPVEVWIPCCPVLTLIVKNSNSGYVVIATRWDACCIRWAIIMQVSCSSYIKEIPSWPSRIVLCKHVNFMMICRHSFKGLVRSCPIMSKCVIHSSKVVFACTVIALFPPSSGETQFTLSEAVNLQVTIMRQAEKIDKIRYD